MESEILNLEPKSLWKHFSNLNAVPRASKKEERVIQFIVDFANNNGFDHKIDEVGNVIVRKNASPGMEHKQTVVLQSHLDMVHQKNADTNFDFDTEGIKMLYANDWVKADGTTLGADNGIGVAAIMAVLSSNEIKHPAIEALFTIDEETGMTGALGLKGGLLSGSIMLNLDTEDDRELTIGCAGGIDITIRKKYDAIAIADNYIGLKLEIKGLDGGHSGMDIHIGKGNANKLMNRILYKLNTEMDLVISSIHGGGLRNAIPRESISLVAIPATSQAAFDTIIEAESKIIKAEYLTTDPNVEIVSSTIDRPVKGLNKIMQNGLLRTIYACPNGIYRMSPDIPDLVQSSNNLAKVTIEHSNAEILCLTRSSVETEKDDLVQAITSVFHLVDADVEAGGAYPGWTPKPNSRIVKMMTELYQKKYNEDPHVNACHAGLECGILGKNYPGMEMISFGPNIRGAHSPDERVQVSSVQKFWDYFLDTLENIPEK